MISPVQSVTDSVNDLALLLQTYRFTDEEILSLGVDPLTLRVFALGLKRLVKASGLPPISEL